MKFPTYENNLWLDLDLNLMLVSLNLLSYIYIYNEYIIVS